MANKVSYSQIQSKHCSQYLHQLKVQISGSTPGAPAAAATAATAAAAAAAAAAAKCM